MAMRLTGELHVDGYSLEETSNADKARIPLADLFAQLPVAAFKAVPCRDNQASREKQQAIRLSEALFSLTKPPRAAPRGRGTFTTPVCWLARNFKATNDRLEEFDVHRNNHPYYPHHRPAWRL